MKRIGYGLAAAVIAGTIGIGTASAKPGGCLKYGAVGAVGGHFAHHHAVLGAAGGCAVGMYRRHEYKKHQRELRREERANGSYSNAR